MTYILLYVCVYYYIVVVKYCRNACSCHALRGRGCAGVWPARRIALWVMYFIKYIYIYPKRKDKRTFERFFSPTDRKKEIGFSAFPQALFVWVTFIYFCSWFSVVSCLLLWFWRLAKCLAMRRTVIHFVKSKASWWRFLAKIWITTGGPLHPTIQSKLGFFFVTCLVCLQIYTA